MLREELFSMSVNTVVLAPDYCRGIYDYLVQIVGVYASKWIKGAVTLQDVQDKLVYAFGYDREQIPEGAVDVIRVEFPGGLKKEALRNKSFVEVAKARPSLVSTKYGFVVRPTFAQELQGIETESTHERIEAAIAYNEKRWKV